MPNVVDGYKWELYNLDEDYSEANDLAAKNPEKLRELQDMFMVEAAKYQVFPLDNSILSRLITPTPELRRRGGTSSCTPGSCPTSRPATRRAS